MQSDNKFSCKTMHDVRNRDWETIKISDAE